MNKTERTVASLRETYVNAPLKQPTKFEFVMKLKTAKIGLTFSQAVLYWADKVIK